MAGPPGGSGQAEEPDWSMAKTGMKLLINNRNEEAVALFKSHPESIQMTSGYGYTLFLNALMSFEEDKVQLALETLHSTEKRCIATMGWMKTRRSSGFGRGLTEDVVTPEYLEYQIILADTQVCMAILTFLQQELSSYLKGGWVLRKAWKLYQQTYLQILTLHEKVIGKLVLPNSSDFEWMVSSVVPDDASVSECGSTTEAGDPQANNGYIPTRQLARVGQSESSHTLHNHTTAAVPIKRSGSVQSSLADTVGHTLTYSRSAFSFLSSQLSQLTASLSALTTRTKAASPRMDPVVVSRLMGGVSFGYGVLQLGVSLLPPSLLKFSNFLGFEGNQLMGLSHLMYARRGSDMRAPLAILALLWFHTLVRPYYALDGNNVKAGVSAANQLLAENKAEYEKSALFLFFSGRVCRLDSDIPAAIEYNRACIDNTTQRELSLLAMYEIGWLRLMQLDYVEARRTFQELRSGSRWSRSFYSYLSLLCTGALGQPVDPEVIVRFQAAFAALANRRTQLETLLQRRFQLIPTKKETMQQADVLFWSVLVYELLFLWNTLPNCAVPTLELIAKDCEDDRREPMPGIAKLIQGECYILMERRSDAIVSLRESLAKRASVDGKEDVHINAFAEYTLGDLLATDPQTRDEGKLLLERAHHHRDYDFDSKLHPRIVRALKRHQ